MSRYTFAIQKLVAVGAFAVTMAGSHLTAQVVKSSRSFTVLTVTNPGEPVDFVHAKAKALPINPFTADATQAMVQALTTVNDLGPSGFSPGAAGTGDMSPIFLGAPELAAHNDMMTTQSFGTSNHPFTTARADLYSVNTNTTYPYSAAGKLFFNEPGGSYICSASMIKRGIAVTAAHCVANFGRKQFYSDWQFVPGYRNGVAPFGVWTVQQAWVPTAYYNGSDSCAVSGVVCADDVAVLILNPQKSTYAGSTVGWFGYWYGGGFTSNGLTEITQLGYPAGLDNAAYMERNNSQGFTSSSNSNNTIIGSNMNGGSSGGPWLVNFGLPYSLTGETNGSGYTFTNAIVGVTSWGSTSTSPKEQGASPFTSGNIQVILNAACGATPAACS